MTTRLITLRITKAKSPGAQAPGLLQMATLVGLEPMTSAVTGRRSNQLSYSAIANRPASTIGTRPGPDLLEVNGGHGWD